VYGTVRCPSSNAFYEGRSAGQRESGPGGRGRCAGPCPSGGGLGECRTGCTSLPERSVYGNRHFRYGVRHLGPTVSKRRGRRADFPREESAAVLGRVEGRLAPLRPRPALRATAETTASGRRAFRGEFDGLRRVEQRAS
jgi:hypothetical protein